MIDSLENVSIQDLALANALGIPIEEVRRVDLSQLKNDLIARAFKMQEGRIDIDQSIADVLNHKFNEIINELMNGDGYDPCEDYMVDFDCFVPENEKYGRFSY